MHSHDRTLLSRLGFADPDRKLAEHDLACQYLAAEAQAAALAELVATGHRHTFVDQLHEDKHGGYANLPRCPCPQSVTIEGITFSHNGGAMTTRRTTRTSDPVTVLTTTLERPLQKGEGQYQTTIGFIDLLIVYSYQEPETGQYLRHPYEAWAPMGTPRPRLEESWEPFTDVHQHRRAVLVEVKITPTSLGDTLRQIKLYDSYLEQAGFAEDRYDWVLATRFPLSTTDVDALFSEDITHVRLGAKFDAWVTARQTPDPTATESPEI